MSILIHNNLDKTLNWEVEETEIYSPNGEIIPGYQALRNSRTGEVLNVCGITYTPISNARLVEIAHNFCENTPFELEGFATYRGGKKVLAYLKNENPPAFAGHKAQDFLVIGNSHDGSTAFFTGLTNFVYRCENMFSQRNMQTRILHRMNAEQELRAMQATHDLYYNELTGVYERAQEMTEHRLTDKELESFANIILDLKEGEPLSTRTQNNRERLLDSIYHETNDLGKNLFGAFNGVTHYTSHQIQTKNRVFGNPFNIQDTLNQRAYNFAVNTMARNPRPKPVQVLEVQGETISSEEISLF